MKLFVFFLYFCVCAPVSFSILCVLVQMSPTKHSTSKKSSKRARMDSDNFKFVEVDMAYNG